MYCGERNSCARLQRKIVSLMGGGRLKFKGGGDLVTGSSVGPMGCKPRAILKRREKV